MSEKSFPEWGCVCDLDPGNPLSRCTIDPLYDGHIDDCLLATLPSGRRRKVPHSCQYWIERAEYEAQGSPGDHPVFNKGKNDE